MVELGTLTLPDPAVEGICVVLFPAQAVRQGTKYVVVKLCVMYRSMLISLGIYQPSSAATSSATSINWIQW